MQFPVMRFVGNKAKGRLFKQVLQENKARQIFQKTNIFHPLIRTQRVRFSENFGALCFLVTPVLRFALLPEYRRFIDSFILDPLHNVYIICLIPPNFKRLEKIVIMFRRKDFNISKCKLT